MGSYDRRLCWFDMDLSTKPYKTLRLVITFVENEIFLYFILFLPSKHSLDGCQHFDYAGEKSCNKIPTANLVALVVLTGMFLMPLFLGVIRKLYVK